MDPFTLALGAIGIGLQIFGTKESAGSSAAYNAAQVQSIGLEQKADAQRRQAMELDARRKQMENLRNIQRAQALAINNSTSQGAQFGSGLQGGLGQIESQGNWNEKGILQNLSIGRNLFDINAQISEQKILMANANQGSEFGKGLSSLGGSLLSATGPAGRLFSGWGPSTSATGPGTFGTGLPTGSSTGSLY